MMLVLFNDYTTKKKTPAVLKFFKSEFPSVYAFLISHKGKEGKSKLAIELQSYEAVLIIDTIGSQLMKQKIKFLTIHDSIVVKTKEQAEIVKKLIYKETQHSITPSLHINQL
jgi:hypothetical protein